MTDPSNHQQLEIGSEREIVIRFRHVALAVLPFIAIIAGMAIGAGRISFANPTDALDASSGLWLVFLTGLSVGGLSCLAVQGSLLTTTIMRREQQVLGSDEQYDIAGRLGPVVQFLAAKAVAYTILGAILGYFGSKIPSSVQGWLLIGVGFFMLIVVLQMYDVHPIFRRISFQPPKRVQRLIRAESKKGAVSGPAILGAMTVLIPCGVTIAMEGLAMASESPIRGALIMLVFTLGTAPLFLVLGFLATNLSRGSYRVFKPAAALLVVVVSGYTILGGTRLLGMTSGIGAGEGAVVRAAMVANGENEVVQEATINVTSSAYSPDVVRLQAGIPTRLSVVSEKNAGCTRAFTIPSLDVDIVLPVTGLEMLELPPVEPGRIVFTCGMGMFSGVLDVVAAVPAGDASDS